MQPRDRFIRHDNHVREGGRRTHCSIDAFGKIYPVFTLGRVDSEGLQGVVHVIKNPPSIGMACPVIYVF